MCILFFTLAVYPSLVDESEVVSEVGCAMTRAGRRKVEEEDDDLWTPHGEGGAGSDTTW